MVLIFLIVFFPFFTKTVPIHWGVCAPKQCSEEDVTKALQEIFTGTHMFSVVSFDEGPRIDFD